MPGKHNEHLEESRTRLIKGQSYRDLSTVCIIPTRGVIPAKTVEALINLMTPMNQKFHRIFVIGKEVGLAYNETFEAILNNAELSKWKYILTFEEDNIPPPDGLLKLYESMSRFDAVGGLYWTKGTCGQPMIYGSPGEMPKNFVPQLPIPNVVQECNGLGMGFTLFKTSMFKKVPKPWFKTVQEYQYGTGGRAATQDLFFFDKAGKEGFRFASDNRVLVGHLDVNDGTVW